MKLLFNQSLLYEYMFRLFTWSTYMIITSPAIFIHAIFLPFYLSRIILFVYHSSFYFIFKILKTGLEVGVIFLLNLFVPLGCLCQHRYPWASEVNILMERLEGILAKAVFFKVWHATTGFRQDDFGWYLDMYWIEWKGFWICSLSCFLRHGGNFNLVLVFNTSLMHIPFLF